MAKMSPAENWAELEKLSIRMRALLNKFDAHWGDLMVGLDELHHV